MLRRVLLSMSRSQRIRHLTETAPVSRSVVARFVAGTSAEEAVAATRDLVSKGLLASLDRLGEDTLDLHQATDTRDAYLHMLELLAAEGLTGRRRGVGEAVRGRARHCPATARRSRWRTPAPSAPPPTRPAPP